MALDDILAAIRAEADTEAQRLVDEAALRSSALLDQAGEDAAAERHRLAHSRDEGARVTAQRISSRAHLEAARVRRQARERFYQDTLAATVERLDELRSSPDFKEIQGRLLDEAIEAMPSATTVSVDPLDIEMVGHLLQERRLNVTVEPSEPGWGGMVLTDDGRTVRNDLASRLERADDHLRAIAASIVPELRGERT